MQEIKIAFAGLQAAGKTSIVLTLDDKPLDKVTPTLGVSHTNTFVNIFGLKVFRWDLGGQASFREGYLRNFKKFFSNAKLVVYVLDVPDKKLHKEALGYLEAICKNFRQLGETPLISVLFHKVDPEIKDDDDVKEIIRKLKKKTSQILEGFTYKYFHTSVKDAYTVKRAFSLSLTSTFSQGQVIDMKMRELGKAFPTDIVMLNDQNGFLLGRYVKEGSDIRDANHFAKTVNWLAKHDQAKIQAKDIDTIPLNEQVDIVIAAFKAREMACTLSLQAPKGKFPKDDRLQSKITEAVEDFQDILSNWK